MSDSELHRQIHPGFLQDGEVGSNAYLPSKKDNDRLSAYDGQQITAEESHKHYTEILGFESYGAQSVTVDECENLSLGVDIDGIPFKQHVSIDFSNLGNSAKKKAAKKLRNLAKARGWQYKPGG